MASTTTTPDFSRTLSQNLKIGQQQVANTLQLLIDGGTVPFIARYRKEATGSLDEVTISMVHEGYLKLVELEKRRVSILETLKGGGQLTAELRQKIKGAEDLASLEDIYLPYRPKRKTRAEKAREQGLEPVTRILQENRQAKIDFSAFIVGDNGVYNVEEALSGARDILAEEISENAATRAQLRNLFSSQAVIQSTVVKKNKELGEKYKDYFQWQERARDAAGHRLLAMFRGEKQKILKLSIRPPQESALRILKKSFLTPGPWQKELNLAIEDSYTRLLGPSLETELARNLKEKADEEAIGVFGENLRQLLLAAPLGPKRVLAIDPGYRTGGKVVCLDGQGNLLTNTTIYPTLGEKQKQDSAEAIRNLVQKYQIEAIAIGNGTAGRETESFVRALDLQPAPVITLVNEDGASIYSASDTARREFPTQDITVRGAVSIGRRLQDPLAELVKIDPKSIGVGQYQHDVNQNRLKTKLAGTVESCVNSVGVELNSASLELLTHVAGLSDTLARNIVEYRKTITSFKDRKELLKVPRLGPKAFEQCAGFLRISGGPTPLDCSAVHPERYKLVEQMAKDLKVTVNDLLNNRSLQQRINVDSYIDEQTGRVTIEDILEELAKPGRDPREEFEVFQFDEDIQDINDLKENMLLPAVITNITKFGAFADLGIKENGLIHISQLADRFVKEPGEVVSLGQKVTVRVIEIDTGRKRIALSLKGL